MKKIKNICLRLNIYFCIDFIRWFIRIVRYIKNGCSGAPPDPLKRKIILAYLSKYDLKCFIETGTYIGDTLAYIVRGKRKSIKAISIELDKVLFKAAKKRFSSFGNILILHGNSGQILPKLVKELN